jgi:heme/copper-type cytochrome/quinol oxidase subunit 4
MVNFIPYFAGIITVIFVIGFYFILQEKEKND